MSELVLFKLRHRPASQKWHINAIGKQAQCGMARPPEHRVAFIEDLDPQDICKHCLRVVRGLHDFSLLSSDGEEG